MISPYTKQTESLMVLHYSHISERDRRHYAAIEAIKLGRGGTSYISKLLGISRTTIISYYQCNQTVGAGSSVRWTTAGQPQAA